MTYTITTVVRTQLKALELASLIQEAYNEGDIDGTFKATKSTHSDFVYLTFERDLGLDHEYICTHMADSNFHWSASYAARYQLAVEFKAVGYPTDITTMVHDALLTHGSVEFPPCEVPNPLEPGPAPT